MSIKKFMKQSKLTDKPITEAVLKQVHFRKKWLDDKSGYWWEKTLKSRMIPVNILYDPDTCNLQLRTKVLDIGLPHKRETSWEPIQVVPASVLNLKRILVNGALIAATK